MIRFLAGLVLLLTGAWLILANEMYQGSDSIAVGAINVAVGSWLVLAWSNEKRGKA